jgi:hypothetical protein
MPIEALITLRSIIIALDMATPHARGSAETVAANKPQPTDALLAAGQELRPSGESSRQRQ